MTVPVKPAAAWARTTPIAVFPGHHDDDLLVIERDTQPRHTVSQASRVSRLPAPDESTEAELTRRVRLTPAAAIRPRPVRWAIPGRVPLGSVTLLAGREGLGKSVLAAAWTAQATLGRLGGDLTGPVPVLIVAAEDAVEFTVVPRLMAAGANLGLVHFVTVTLPTGGETTPVLPLDGRALTQAIADTGARVLVIDPLVSVLDGRLDSHRDHSIRQALDPLNQLAAASGCAIVGLVHLGKAQAGDLNDRVLGSRAFTAAARSVVGVLPDPEDEDERMRLIVQAKSNLGRLDLPALLYAVEGATVDTDEGPSSIGVAMFHGERDVDLTEIMRGPVDQDERTERDDAADWLRGYLTEQGGEAARADLRKAATREGLAWRTVERARSRAGVQSRRHGFPSTAVWVLDPSAAPVAPVTPVIPVSHNRGATGATGATGPNYDEEQNRA